MDKRVYVFTNPNGTPESTTQGQGEGVPQVSRLNRKQRRRAMALLAAEQRKIAKHLRESAPAPSDSTKTVTQLDRVQGAQGPYVVPSARILDDEPARKGRALTPEEKDLLRQEFTTMGWTFTQSGRFPSSGGGGHEDQGGGHDG